MKKLIDSYLTEEPNAAYREEISSLAGQNQLEELEDRLEGHWRFGTAGFRAKMEAGYLRINRVSIAKIAYALGKHLAPASLVVVGFDARHHSSEYALLTAQVLNALGHKSLIFQKHVPTPICAFSVRELKASAGVMITASHNPPKDNGVKIYGADGAQLTAPHTHQIEAILDATPKMSEIPRSELPIEPVPASVLEAYFSGLPKAHASNYTPIIYTPMHGVGEYYALRAFKQAGFDNVLTVPSQAKPDGDFPTVSFPNPEEPGALDKALELAHQTKASLILANDPDADRLAVCVDGVQLDGNQIGVLLAAHLLESPPHQHRLSITTFVSSRMLSQIAAKNHVSYAETATGFANIAHEAIKRFETLGEELIFAYEEALGYCVDKRVRDKDGISAAVLFAQIFTQLEAKKISVFERLDQLALTYGLHRNLSWSIRLPKDQQSNLLSKAQNLPMLQKEVSPAPGLLVYLGENHLRLIIRPSGTEPKIKFYAEAIAYPKDLQELKAMTKKLDDFLSQTCLQVTGHLHA